MGNLEKGENERSGFLKVENGWTVDWVIIINESNEQRHMLKKKVT